MGELWRVEFEDVKQDCADIANVTILGALLGSSTGIKKEDWISVNFI